MIIFKAFFITFLLMPLIAFLMVGIMFLVQKKNAAANNKKLIIYILLASITLGLPGFGGMAGNSFNPYWYLFSQIIYFFLGILHVNLLSTYFKSALNGNWFTLLQECLITLICIVLGMYFFTILFNLTSPFKGFAWMSATSIFIFTIPLMFYYTWIKYTDIPFDIYKVWVYDSTKEAVQFDGSDFNKLMVLNVEFTKKVKDGHRFSAKAKSPSHTILGDWFYRFIDDYRVKYPQDTIEVTDDEVQPYAWIFYKKASFFHRRKYLDFEKSIKENNITENVTIICKRVIETQEEKLVSTKKSKLSI